jgi:hypothetical protein
MLDYFIRTQKYDKAAEPLFEEIESVVKTTIFKPIPVLLGRGDYLAFKINGERVNFERRYFERRKLLTSYSIFLQYDSDNLAFKYFLKLIDSTLAELSWALPAHLDLDDFETSRLTTIDLFASETAELLAEIRYIFRNKLPRELSDRILKQIQYRIIDPFEKQIWDWESKENNWNAVCSSCLGMVILLTPEIKLKDKLIRRINVNLQIYLDSFGHDGICTEGLEYWDYGFGYFIYYYDLMKNFTDVNPFKKEQIRNIGKMPYRIQLSKGQYANFSDISPKQPLATGLVNYLNDFFDCEMPVIDKVSELGFDQCYRYAHISRNLWWTKKLNVTTLERYKEYFPSSQWLIDRSKDWSVICKGGNNQESHNHHDVGSLILVAKGKVILADLGAPLYTADYFGTKRYETVHAQSSWHSVPQFLDHEQLNFKNNSETSYCRSDQFSEFKLDLTRAYEMNVIREYQVSNGKLVLYDQFSDGSNFLEHFIFSERPILTDLGCNVRINDHFSVNFSWGKNLKTISKIEVHNHLGQKESYYRLNIKVDENIFNLVATLEEF